LQRVAARCDVNIVVATGHYSFSGLPPYLYSPALDENGRHVSIDAPTDGPDPIVELFVRDIEVGIGTTGVKAGLIKCVTDAGGVDAGVERLVRATGRAHRRTGVPISTHTHAGTRRGLDQQRILADEGVDLSRVIIGHCGDSTDLEYLEQLIDAGSYLGMDRFGFDAAGSFEQRVGVLVEMCRRGHAEHMVLSHDAACVFHGTEDVPTDHSPNWHWRHLFEAVLPALARAGVTDQQIDQMLVVNPRQIFSERRAYS
jgi:phosphotriesterase-related protein